jgi:hypothetical protein
MILRLSDFLSRGLVLLLAVVVALGLSYFGVRMALAGLAVEEETANGLERAVRLEPRNPDYWYRLAHFQQFNLESSNPARSLESYQRAIALFPGHTDALLDLATLYELEGDPVAAREAYQRAKQSYPASAEVSWRYGNFLLRQGDLPEAYAELRRALQADPRRAAAAFSRAYRANPNAEEILEQLLPAVPRVYIDVISEATAAKQLAVARQVWNRLLTLQPRLQIQDFDTLVSALLAAGEYEDARRVWDQGIATMDLPPLLQPKASVVWDPSFESGINGYAFAWHLLPLTQGVQTTFDPREKLSGLQSLRVSFDGKHNPNLEIACTVAVVQPGTRYIFSGWIKAREITTDHGVNFHLRSIGGTAAPVITTREIHGTTPWSFVDQTWTAGSDAHRIQICVSREPSDDPDVRISGNAWIDDVTLAPQPMERHKP